MPCLHRAGSSLASHCLLIITIMGVLEFYLVNRTPPTALNLSSNLALYIYILRVNFLFSNWKYRKCSKVVPGSVVYRFDYPSYSRTNRGYVPNSMVAFHHIPLTVATAEPSSSNFALITYLDSLSIPSRTKLFFQVLEFFASENQFGSRSFYSNGWLES